MKVIKELTKLYGKNCRWAGMWLFLILATLAGCQQSNRIDLTDTDTQLPNQAEEKGLEIAIFAGGCFWCTEADFDKVPGVVKTISGYVGGTVTNPTYEQVSKGKTGHVEAVQIYFDPTKTSYAKLLAAYWPTIDPLTAGGQFCDVGSQYRSAIFYRDAHQHMQAEASKSALIASGRFDQPIVTEILPATTFYPAEEYHQDFYLKNPIRYSYYRSKCGRDARLAQLWGNQ
ncbi:peptide-methionine (S)-S-oxide reductase MsrA [Nitrosomonas sp. Nm33]|uniref:peptide-methionine (S)-S-oxide reductase MsrA n=1 Tax=Nitrosomonas sp. Nm33 TaxID=133724 RepID=UPI0008942A40|nr:peptide-methionine (S)-S-oxide reductase MsrA [Nitrosomonas sp. Nm33]SDX98340.1 peptide-methionine (S)-S-oxide reductase [Nitrosomonas sp. Nm33]